MHHTMSNTIYSLSSLSSYSDEYIFFTRPSTSQIDLVKVEPIEVIKIEREEDETKSEAVFHPAKYFSTLF